MSGGTLYVNAGSGDANAFKVTKSGSNFIAEDKTTLTLSAGAGCTKVATYKVSCPGASISEVSVASGDLGDSINVNVPVDATLYGSSGDDSLIATGTGSKYFGGGSGSDIVSYAASTVPIFGSINGTYDDGPFETGGWDYIASDVEVVGSGSANDILIGADTSHTTLSGNGGNDSLAAGNGGADMLGGSGNDTLTGSAASDWMSGGSGTDKFDGKGGNDTIFAKDGVAGEKVTCGSGVDEITVDTTDVITDPANCETVHY